MNSIYSVKRKTWLANHTSVVLFLIFIFHLNPQICVIYSYIFIVHLGRNNLTVNIGFVKVLLRYNWHTDNYMYLKYTILKLEPIYRSVKPSSQSSTPKVSLCLFVILPTTPLPCPVPQAATDPLSVITDYFALSRIVYKCNHSACTPFSLASFIII